MHLPAITTGLDAASFLPDGVDDTQAARLAAEAGIETRPLSFYAADEPVAPGLMLGFAAVGPEEIGAGARTLAQVLEPLCRYRDLKAQIALP